MDNVTHGLFGLGIYGAWATLAPHPHSDLAIGVLAAAVLGSEAPDFDYAIRVVAGPVAYLRHHRGVSHSIPFWLLWPGAITLALTFTYPGHAALLFGIALAGVLLHVGTDLLTSYGTQAFWPLSARRWAWDTLFIVDVVLWIVGFGCWLQVHRTGDIGRWTTIGWSLAAAYVACKAVYAARLRRRVRRRFGSGWRVSVIPGPLPWMWNFVAQSDDRLLAGRVRRSGIAAQVSWPMVSEMTEAVRFALQHSRVGRVFAWFARHLMWRETCEADAVRVSLADATYRYGQRLPFGAYVRVRRDGTGAWSVAAESLRLEQPDVAAFTGEPPAELPER
ncbi:MAG: metal-dependent hydrolase [Alicyclobacillaceae bacterium]|nr:metal-dependent hydrolase [Alicyclobacillaceae bacterium]